MSASKMVTIDTESNELVLRIPMQEPVLSSTGKMFLIGSTGGFTKTGFKLANGAEVKINVTAGFQASPIQAKA